MKPHVPFAQVALAFAGAVQVVPQAPQWAGLVLRVTHEPLHRVPEHVVWHEPLEQTWLDPQATPHPPQFFGSVWVFTQLEPHFASPDPHTNPQAPPLQLAAAPAGGVHALPHAPQWLTLVSVSTQSPAQAVRLPAQDSSHAPLSHLAWPPVLL